MSMPTRSESPLNDENYNWMTTAPDKYGGDYFVEQYHDFFQLNPKLNADVVPTNDRVVYYMRRWFNAPHTGGAGERMKIQLEIDREFPLMPGHFKKTIMDIDTALQMYSTSSLNTGAWPEHSRFVYTGRMMLQKLGITDLPRSPATAITYIEAMGHFDAMRGLLTKKMAELEALPATLIAEYESAIAKLRWTIKTKQRVDSNLELWREHSKTGDRYTVMVEIANETGDQVYSGLPDPPHLLSEITENNLDLSAKLREISRLNKLALEMVAVSGIQIDMTPMRHLQIASAATPPTPERIDAAETCLKDLEIKLVSHDLVSNLNLGLIEDPEEKSETSPEEEGTKLHNPDADRTDGEWTTQPMNKKRVSALLKCEQRQILNLYGPQNLSQTSRQIWFIRIDKLPAHLRDAVRKAGK